MTASVEAVVDSKSQELYKMKEIKRNLSDREARGKLESALIYPVPPGFLSLYLQSVPWRCLTLHTCNFYFLPP
jgi:hypothetical protein